MISQRLRFNETISIIESVSSQTFQSDTFFKPHNFNEGVADELWHVVQVI